VSLPTRRLVLGLLTAAPAFAAHAKPASGEVLIAAARRQIGVTIHLDQGYQRIAYPGGDVPISTGVCADVVVRAVRTAWGLDLQRLVHEDMVRAFAVYPHRWGMRRPDPNIDHRRVPNLETYWTRQGACLWRADPRRPSSGFPSNIAPGDFVTWRAFGGGGPHVAIVTTGGPSPRVIENAGWGAREDALTGPMLNGSGGHYRWRPNV